MNSKTHSQRSIRLYDANYDPKLVEKRNQTKFLLQQYNAIDARQLELREKAIKSLFKKTGENLNVEQPFYCDYGDNISVGENFYSNHNLIILDGAPVTIGDNCFIAPNVGIHTAGHPIDHARRNQGLEYALPICIGNNVWIGASAIILPGVTIGDNSVIGAGSVVTKDIPANVIAVGNPCRAIRDITEQDALDYQDK